MDRKPDKTVRDRVPEIMRQNGEDVREGTHYIVGDAFATGSLITQLVEEARELYRVGAGDKIDRLADISEIVLRLANDLGFDAEQLNRIREARLEDQGGFTRNILLFGEPLQQGLITIEDADSGKVAKFAATTPEGLLGLLRDLLFSYNPSLSEIYISKMEAHRRSQWLDDLDRLLMPYRQDSGEKFTFIELIPVAEKICEGISNTVQGLHVHFEMVSVYSERT